MRGPVAVGEPSRVLVRMEDPLREAVPVTGLPSLALHALAALGLYAVLAAGLGRGGPYPTVAWLRTAAAQVALARAPQGEKP